MASRRILVLSIHDKKKLLLLVSNSRNFNFLFIFQGNTIIK